MNKKICHNNECQAIPFKSFPSLHFPYHIQSFLAPFSLYPDQSKFPIVLSSITFVKPKFANPNAIDHQLSSITCHIAATRFGFYKLLSRPLSWRQSVGYSNPLPQQAIRWHTSLAKRQKPLIIVNNCFPRTNAKAIKLAPPCRHRFKLKFFPSQKPIGWHHPLAERQKPLIIVTHCFYRTTA